MARRRRGAKSSAVVAELPEDAWVHVFSMLRPRLRLRLCCVAKSWNHAIKVPQLWRHIILRPRGSDLAGGSRKDVGDTPFPSGVGYAFRACDAPDALLLAPHELAFIPVASVEELVIEEVPAPDHMTISEPEELVHHADNWPSLLAVASRSFPRLTAVSLPLESLTYRAPDEQTATRVAARRDTVFKWLSALPAGLKYIDLSYGLYVADYFVDWCSEQQPPVTPLATVQTLKGLSWHGDGDILDVLSSRSDAQLAQLERLNLGFGVYFDKSDVELLRKCTSICEKGHCLHAC